MSSLYAELRNGGLWTLLITVLGLFGLVLGVASVILAAGGARAARAVGLAAVALAAVVLSLGAVGVMMNHRIVDRALAGSGVSATTTERIEREGYLEAKSCAKFGLGAALVPLLGGTLALLLARRRDDDASGGLVLPVAMVGFAALVAAGDAALVAQKLPGRDYAPGDPIWQLLEAQEEIDGGRVTEGCRRLEDSVGASGIDGTVADPPRLPDFPRVAGVCVDARIAAALAAAPGERRGELGKILGSRPGMVDEAHRKRVEEELARLPGEEEPALGGLSGFGGAWGLGGAPGANAGPALQPGELSVNGRLPPEVIRRILRQQAGALRRCYDAGLVRRPDLEGDVQVKFIIDREGAVSLAARGPSTLPDADVIACIVGVIRKLTFPRPEGGLVTVIYPLRFTPSGMKP